MGSAKKKKRLAVAHVADNATLCGRVAATPPGIPRPPPCGDIRPTFAQHRLVSGINKTHYFLALLLILATALLYGHSLWNPLVFDDDAVLFDANLERLGLIM